MASFNDLNGVPCTVNPFTLRKMLKETYGLEGFVVSDANAIRECVVHGIAADEPEAGVQAANGGLDMDMGTGIYRDHLKKAVEAGEVSMEVIDEAVERILRVKMWLGLFDHPYVPAEVIGKYEELPEENKTLARRSAEESIVLLKNEGNILPLKQDAKISLVGQLADSREEVIGAWAISWKEKDCVSIREGMESRFDSVEYFPCGGPSMDLNEEDIRKAGEYGDVIVAVVGELVSMSGEASSRADITLPGQQRELLAKLMATGKPVVAVLMNGRPLALGWEAEHVPVIVEGWHLGIQMGNAVAEVLAGDVNPSAHLAASFPAVTGQCPIYYNHPNTGRPGGKSKFTSRYLDAPFDALYPFGYGLSYTEYVFSDLNVKETDDCLNVTVYVENVGDREGTEVVQLYMRDVTASIVRPVKELKDFRRVSLRPGEKKEVAFTLKKQDMGFYNNEGEYRLESGEFRIYVGGNSRDCLEVSMTLKF